MHAFACALLCLLFEFVYSVYNDVICYKNWYFDSPRPAPRKCPDADLISYYECCGDSDACCRRVRVELLTFLFRIFLFVPLTVLVVVLCCCTICAMCRQRGKHKDKQQPRLSRDERECHYFY